MHSTYVSEDNSTFSLRLFTPLVFVSENGYH